MIAATFILTFAALYGGANVFIGKRIYQGLVLLFPNINIAVYICIYIIIALTLFSGFAPIPVTLRRWFFSIGAYWVGIFVYLLLFFILADIVLFFGRILQAAPSPVPQNIRFYTALVVIVKTAALVIYGMRNVKKLHHAQYEIQTQKAASPAPAAEAESRASQPDSLKIALVSDLHLGAVNSERSIERIVQGINNLNPDLVCMAGDIFDDIELLRNPARVIELFKSINARYGVYACLGNHDGGGDLNEMLSFLEQSNINVLKDEHRVIADRLVLIGRLDPIPIGGFGGLKRKNITDVLANVDASLPVVVMDHNPANIKEYGNKVDLILAGHTHRGQIFPVNLLTRAIFDVDYGHYQKEAGSPHVIVTSGASTWGMPMRIGTCNEIVGIVLRQVSPS